MYDCFPDLDINTILFDSITFYYMKNERSDNVSYSKVLHRCYGVCLISVTVAMAAELEATPIGIKFY